MEQIWESYQSYAGYLWREITQPGWHNYFYALLAISLFFFLLEIIKPWRKNQALFRKDFWLDFFYMFFNFFLFALIIYHAASDVVVHFFNNIIIRTTGFDLQASNPMRNWPLWAILIIGFVVRDFVQWWVHRLLHRVPFLWRFHKVHHSVEQMGFAAHLRYHWMETIVYRTIEYIPLALLGIGLYDFFIIHIFTLAWGHFNHSNISVKPRTLGGIIGFLIGIAIAGGYFDIHFIDESNALTTAVSILGSTTMGYFVLGPFTHYIFNSPEMHIWHHAKDIGDHKFGVNFGITLSIWDYIFGQAYIPHNGRDEALGFSGVKQFPATFWQQIIYGFKK